MNINLLHQAIYINFVQSDSIQSKYSSFSIGFLFPSVVFPVVVLFAFVILLLEWKSVARGLENPEPWAARVLCPAKKKFFFSTFSKCFRCAKYVETCVIILCVGCQCELLWGGCFEECNTFVLWAEHNRIDWWHSSEPVPLSGTRVRAGSNWAACAASGAQRAAEFGVGEGKSFIDNIYVRAHATVIRLERDA